MCDLKLASAIRSFFDMQCHEKLFAPFLICHTYMFESKRFLIFDKDNPGKYKMHFLNIS